jgi:uncharacterized protein
VGDDVGSGNPDSATCWCCGEARATPDLTRLPCHPEVAVCRGCLGWLDQQAGGSGQRVHRAVPILSTADRESTLRHYATLGFDTESWEGGRYGFLSRDGVEVHVAETDDSPTNPTSFYLFVSDADALHAEWSKAAAAGELEAPFDTDYGLREGRHVDPDGNVIRFGSPSRVADEDAGNLLAPDDPLALAATTAIQTGDVEALVRLVTEHLALTSARIGDREQSRTLLHVATDWPGHHPRVGETIRALAEAGADVNARFTGAHAETPLHWAASSDDVEAIDALVDAGAEINASGAVLGGGAPLADAVGFGQWNAARRLVERGAPPRLKDAAALGLMPELMAQFDTDNPPETDAVTEAFWSACHGGQREAAEYLLAQGADLNWVGWDDLTPLDIAANSNASALVEWLRMTGAKSAQDLG